MKEREAGDRECHHRRPNQLCSVFVVSHVFYVAPEQQCIGSLCKKTTESMQTRDFFSDYADFFGVSGAKRSDERGDFSGI